MANRNSRVESWIALHEKTIAAVSGIATAIGLAFAAISSFAAFEQIKAANRERMTPYKVILYNAKIDAYRRFVVAANKFDDDVSFHYAEARASVDKNDIDVLPSIRRLIDNDLSIFQISVRQDQAIWSSDQEADFESILDAARKLAGCANRYIGITTPVLFFKPKCSNDTLYAESLELSEQISSVSQKLRSEIDMERIQGAK